MTATTTQPSAAPDERGRLHRRALGVPDLVFFIVAASAPLTAVAGGQAATYLVTGNRGVPFMFVPLGIMLALFAVGYAAMSRHVANAGAFYSYVAQGLGKVQAVGAAFVALIAYNAMQIGIYGLFGVALGAFMSDKLGITLDWWAWCLIGGAVIGALGLLQIDLNARVLGFFLVLEVLVVALFDLAILADPGPQGLTAVGFDPGVAFGSAVGSTLLFCVASFVGFESAAIYSEEVRDPKRTVARATFIAVGLIAVFYAISGWLVGVAAGPDTIVDPGALVQGGFTTPDGAGPDPTTVLFATGGSRLGAFWGDAASLLFATSLFAALLSFHNAVARYGFALGRERVIPRVYGRVHPRTGAPWVASITQTVLALAVVSVFALAGKDPVLHLFTWLTNLGALGVLLLMAVTSFAVVAYFRRAPDSGVSRWAAAIAPAIAGVLLVVVLVLGVLNFNVLITGSTDAPTDSMAIILPVILFGGGVLGLALGALLKISRPHVFAGIGTGGADLQGSAHDR
jgi:amino acid transporter